jgi:hypothetical protein
MSPPPLDFPRADTTAHVPGAWISNMPQGRAAFSNMPFDNPGARAIVCVHMN